MSSHTCDYLVVGAGATGLAFADTLLAETQDLTITLVDQRGLPGGHWLDAYGFVRLHQPSAFYGVNSLPLGSGAQDTHGTNAGFFELASGAEVCAYYDAVLRKLLGTGRLRFLPLTQHLGEGRLRSLATGEEAQLQVRRAVVDAAYCAPSVPATRAPRYAIGDGARVVPPGALPGLARLGDPPAHYAILGAGKTAMDVGVWLLQAGVPAQRITWVMPRDSWLINRRTTQPGMAFFHDAIGGQAALLAAAARASDAQDLFLRLEAAGGMLRIDRSVTPTMFHFATISEAEVQALRGIEDVVRLGHVQAVDGQGLTLAGGRRALPPGTLCIDCTASAVEPRPMQAVFQPGRIVPQIVRAPLPSFSAALIAHVEATETDEARKNALCRPVPFPDRPADYPRTLLANLRNEGGWAKDPGLRAWMTASRLDGFRKTVEAVRPDEADKMAVLMALRTQAGPAVENLMRMVA